MTTGFLGTPYILHVLSDNGYTDVAYDLLLQEENPSWLFSVNQGATTMWEHWDSIKEDGTFWSTDMNSFNHYAYGAVGEWFFETICGIQPSLAADASKAAFKVFTLAPIPGGGLTYAKAAYESIHGEIRSGWEIDGDILSWSFSVPANTTANITLPQGWTLIDGCSAAKEKLANLFSSNTCSMATAGEYTLKFKKQ
jgi:alpha-L-rhamnosidase